MFEKREYDSHAKENFHCQSTKANAMELERRAKTFNNNQIFNNIMNIRIIILHSKSKILRDKPHKSYL